jgi:hypothetical protein
MLSKLVNKLPALNPLPPGVVQQPAGDAEIMGEIFGRFGTALALAVMCIYAILVLLYNNFLHPLTIMVALPLSLGGTLLGLMIAQKALGFICADRNCAVAGSCDKKLYLASRLYDNQPGRRQATVSSSNSGWYVSAATNFDDLPCYSCGNSTLGTGDWGGG